MQYKIGDIVINFNKQHPSYRKVCVVVKIEDDILYIHDGFYVQKITQFNIDNLMKIDYQLAHELYEKVKEETCIFTNEEIKTRFVNILKTQANDFPNRTFGDKKVLYQEILNDEIILDKMVQEYYTYSSLYTNMFDIVNIIIQDLIGDVNND